jgi:choline-glycine betaine transporter
MDMIADWIWGFVTDFGRRVEYSVLHMTLTQWAIFAVASLVIGFLAMRGNPLR